MIALRRWDYKTETYLPFASPANNLFLFCQDMQAPVDCASCGKQMVYGDTYTSQEIHTSVGMGFPVCEDCHEVEWQRRNDHAAATTP